LLTGLTGHGGDLFEIAAAATYLHGLAGDIVRERESDIGIAAMDLADALPAAVERIRTGR
ncbi:MAG: bifunctional ADP-dependent NAD(P)H-hydrate dehydratase/NAD(P)H-hydrate epimerase, partial [Thermoanaerobaculia bacterium]|nr:bifunctional ADP-dependent NAD(P)H-hydrate dehydratase/NAD(P)H-hydrate epimerase [Thermoanaerobaculia bacterium]